MKEVDERASEVKFTCKENNDSNPWNTSVFVAEVAPLRKELDVSVYNQYQVERTACCTDVPEKEIPFRQSTATWDSLPVSLGYGGCSYND